MCVGGGEVLNCGHYEVCLVMRDTFLNVNLSFTEGVLFSVLNKVAICLNNANHWRRLMGIFKSAKVSCVVKWRKMK